MSRLASAIIDFTETLSSWFSHKILLKDIGAYCDLETSVPDKTALVTSSGGLVSVIRIDGISRAIGPQQQAKLEEDFEDLLRNRFSEDGHSFDWFFQANPYMTRRSVARSLAPSYNSAERIGLDIRDILDDQAEKISNLCVSESGLVSIWTDPSLLPKEIVKRESAEKKKVFQLHPKITVAQNPDAATKSLVHRHAALVTAVIDELNDTIGLRCELVDAHTVLKTIKLVIDPDGTDEKAHIALPGDKITPQGKESAKDFSHLFYQKIPSQLCGKKIYPFTSKYGIDGVQIGRWLYAPLVFYKYPSKVFPFAELFKRIDKNIPWRISFRVEPRGLSKIKGKASIVAILGLVGETNKSIKRAVDGLKRLENDHKIPNYRLRISITTWGKNEEDLERNCSLLSRAVQGWGGADVANDTGDPVAGYISSVPAFSQSNIAVPAVPPVYDLAKILPYSRPASPWEEGAVLFKTLDGKIFNYSPGSSEQDTWINLYFAPPGSGKSVLLNRMAWAFMVSPGLQNLPYYVCIDVGPSSKGMISMVEEALPKDKRYLTGYYLLKNERRYGINPFDTQLGCRWPTTITRDFLVNFFTLLGTEPGKKEPYAGVGDIAGMIVDHAYEFFSDKGSPKRYEPTRDPLVDQAIKDIQVSIDDELTWWEVVDSLFRKGKYHEASRAQRFAVPSLPDLPTIINSQKIIDRYNPPHGDPLKIETGEKLIDAMSRFIETATAEYKILAGETQLDIGMARVLSIDLNELARGEGPLAERRAAILFMLSQNIATRNFFVSPHNVSELLDTSPQIYHSYHEKRAKEIFLIPKELNCDELHRAGRVKSHNVMGSFIQIGREGRKFNFHLGLSSQLLDDFPPELVKISSSVFVLKSGGPEDTEEIKNRFGLTDEEARLLEKKCNGPHPKNGNNFLGIFKTKKGTYVQLLNNRLGSIELWALSTTTEDDGLRSFLYERMSPTKARRLLAEAFPNGSAKPEIERRKNELGVEGEEADNGIIETLAMEILNESQQRKAL